MLVTPLPGVSREELQRTLRDLRSAVSNARSGHAGGAQARLGVYLEWATGAVERLANQVSAADVDRLVVTPAYGRLLSALGTVTGRDLVSQRALNGLVDLELAQRVRAFEGACRALDEQVARWSRPGVFMVFDTSVYVEHEDKLEDLDLSVFLPVGRRAQAVHLLVPVVVVDELDGLKNRASRPAVRWRAAYTLAVFDRLFANGVGPGVLRRADPLSAEPVFEFSTEMVLDPPGHVRLPISDDELVDRALAVEGLAGRGVRLVTFDTGQSTRARAAGLDVEKLRKPVGKEPQGR